MNYSYEKKWKRTIPFFEWHDGDKSRWTLAKYLNFGEGSNIYANTYVYNPENISVGKNTWIGPFVILDGSGGKIEIGDNCSISAGVHIYTHDTVKFCLSGRKKLFDKGPVKIGDNCYLGPHAVIPKGSVIPRGSVIPANSLYKLNQLNFLNKIIV